MKKEQRPNKIAEKLRGIQPQRDPVRLAGCPDQIGCDPHQDIQNRPHNGEQPAGRGQGRLLHGGEQGHGVPGQKRGQRPHCQRKGNAGDQFFPRLFHGNTS